MIGAGYEDGNDAGSLRSDPIFKMDGTVSILIVTFLHLNYRPAAET
jgi:hypothetical protein